MQKTIFLVVLFAIVEISFAHHGRRPDGPMPNPPPTPPTQEIENESSAVHRVVREMPDKMPSMEEMKQFAEEQISKLPQPMQDTIHKAQEMIMKNMKDA